MHVLPHIISTVYVRVVITGGGEFRVLIILALSRVLRREVTIVEREVSIAETTHSSNIVGTNLLIPVQMRITQHVLLLREDRSRLGIDSTEVLDSERGQTDIRTIVCL